MKNKLAVIVTGAMLLLTTNSLASYALETPEHSITHTATNQTIKNEELLSSQRGSRRRRRGRWITRRVTVCSRKRVYNSKQKKWVVVRICRRVPRKVFVRY